MRLASRVKSLERTALVGGGICCHACGLPRQGWPAGMSLVAVAPPIAAHIDAISAMSAAPIEPPCGLCGRARAFRIPVPERARRGAEEAA